MKRLILVRHAEAAEGTPDRDRELTVRGRQQAEQMGRWLRSLLPHIDCVLVSPAVRARQTAELLFAACAQPPEMITAEGLYTSDLDAGLRELWSLEPQVATVAVVGHNPLVSELRNYLTGGSYPAMPTCAVAVLSSSVEQWSRCAAGIFREEHFATPDTATSRRL